MKTVAAGRMLVGTVALPVMAPPVIAPAENQFWPFVLASNNTVGVVMLL